MRTMTMAVLALGLIFAGCNSARAQSVYVGAFGGLNRATLSASDNSLGELGQKNGFNAGAFVGLDLSETFAVQLGGMYSRKGSTVEQSDLEGDFSADYIGIPLLARFTIPTQAGERLTFHLFAGPAVSFETRCRVSADVGGQRREEDCDSPDVQAAHKTTDYSLLFGGGIGIGAGPGDMQLDLMYDLALRNLNDEPGDDTKIKTRTLMLTAGYILPIGGR